MRSQKHIPKVVVAALAAYMCFVTLFAFFSWPSYLPMWLGWVCLGVSAVFGLIFIVATCLVLYEALRKMFKR